MDKEKTTKKIAFIGKIPGFRKEQVGGKKQMSIDNMLVEYLLFKNECVDNKIFDINEIIKLFEVWIKSK